MVKGLQSEGDDKEDRGGMEVGVLCDSAQSQQLYQFLSFCSAA